MKATTRRAALCLALALCLAACGAPSSSRDPYAVFEEPSSAPSAQPAPAAPSPTESVPAESASSPPASDSAVDDSLWQLCFVSLPLTRTDGTTGDNGLVILRAPEDWAYDDYTTFSRKNAKIAELPGLWQAAEGGSPFTDAMTVPFEDNSMYPEGFGLVASEEMARGENILRLLHLRVWLDDSDKPSYLHAAFYALDGCVVEARLFTEEEWGGADSDAFLTMLDSIELHFQEE